MNMPEVLRHQNGQRFPNYFPGSVTEDFLHRAIDEQDGAAFIDGEDRVRGGFCDNLRELMNLVLRAISIFCREVAHLRWKS